MGAFEGFPGVQEGDALGDVSESSGVKKWYGGKGRSVGGIPLL